MKHTVVVITRIYFCTILTYN